MSRETFRPPNGEMTEDSQEYTRAWRDLAEPFERRMGWVRVAYDPDVLFMRPGSTSVNIQVDLATEFERMDRQLQEVLPEKEPTVTLSGKMKVKKSMKRRV